MSAKPPTAARSPRDGARAASPQSPTLRDVAAAAGVHAGTASRALSPKTRQLVSADTVRRVLQAAETLGYRPNPIARGLKTARSGTIGLVIPDLTNPLFPPIVRGIEDVLEPAGYTGLIVNTDNVAERERAQIETLRSRQVEGLIVATARRHHPLLAELDAQGVSMVLLNRRVENVEIPFVSADDAGGVARAMAHLAGLGHRRIAHLAGPPDTSTGVLRARAFRHALADHDLAYDPALVVECPRWNEQSGAEATRALLDRGAPFTAVMAGNDLIALGCVAVLAERGIRCPDEVSLVGFNDMPFVGKVSPPLTTIAVPHHDLGAEAARMLLARLEDPSRRPVSLLLPTSLIVRGSTARPGGAAG